MAVRICIYEIYTQRAYDTLFVIISCICYNGARNNNYEYISLYQIFH